MHESNLALPYQLNCMTFHFEIICMCLFPFCISGVAAVDSFKNMLRADWSLLHILRKHSHVTLQTLARTLCIVRVIYPNTDFLVFAAPSQPLKITAKEFHQFDRYIFRMFRLVCTEAFRRLHMRVPPNTIDISDIHF